MDRPVALITGASRGIGRGIARTLAADGHDIAAVATRMESFEAEGDRSAFEAEMAGLGARCLCLAGDIADCAGHDALLDKVMAHFGRVDVLVNNAGVAPLKRVDVLECTEESYDRVMGINLRGPFFFTQRAAIRMAAQPPSPSGRAPKIVFITSISSTAASPSRAEYCLSKAALSMAAKCFAVRMAELGVLVYDVRPGVTATDMTAAVREKYDRLIGEGLLLTKRWGTPEDVGRAVSAIAGGAFDYSTGMVVEVGGGFGVERL